MVKKGKKKKKKLGSITRRDKEQSKWIRKYTKVDGILSIKNKVLTQEVTLHVELIIDSWTIEVNECQFTNYWSQDTQRTKWENDIRIFSEAELFLH